MYRVLGWAGEGCGEEAVGNCGPNRILSSGCIYTKSIKLIQSNISHLRITPFITDEVGLG